MQDSTREEIEAVPAAFMQLLRALGPHTSFVYLMLKRSSPGFNTGFEMSQRDLMALTRLSGATVRNAVAGLEDAQLVITVKGENQHGATRYILPCSGSDGATADTSVESVEAQVTIGAVQSSDPAAQQSSFSLDLPVLSLDLGGVGGKPEKAPAKKKLSADENPRFAEFWQVYPRRDAKKGAIVSFNKAVDAGADIDEIIAGAERYVAYIAATGSFQAMPTTWLNNARWHDENKIPTNGVRTFAAARGADAYSDV